MTSEEPVRLEHDAGHPARLVRADQTVLEIVEVLERWRNPNMGKIASASLKVIEAFRLTIATPTGERREVSIRQYGGSNAWHLRDPRAARPQLRRLPGSLTGRSRYSRPNRMVLVLMDDGAWRPATVLGQWQLPDGQWCVMLQHPLPEQATTSTQPYVYDAAAFRPMPDSG